jgi:hypothetical protein
MRSDQDLYAYFGPMTAFLCVVAVEDWFPAPGALFWLALRLIVPLAALIFFARRGLYPELGAFRWGPAAAADVALGVAVAAVWVAPYLLWPQLRPGAGEVFDPLPAGESARGLALALRFAGFSLVTPFAEELLVRSFILRVADAWGTDRDFREISVGTFAWRSFIVTVVWFTFTHASWEWPVAFATGVIYNAWLYRRKHIGALVIAHAVTNAALFLFVALGPVPDLWFFL